MNTKRYYPNTRFLRLAVLVSIISSAISAFLLFRLNGIVHGQLYNFGLQFSLDWASPYWDTEHLLYGCLAVSSVFGGLALAHSFFKAKSKLPLTERAETKPAVIQSPVKTATVSNSMIITCPKCRREFGRPLNMLDFSKGQAQLVNVCPYCSYILGSTTDEHAENTRVILPDNTEIKQK
jgi:DNA-directed RNA polymerase subunit RPC12/RpoP